MCYINGNNNNNINNINIEGKRILYLEGNDEKIVKILKKNYYKKTYEIYGKIIIIIF